ncbi:MAG: signal peptidase II [Bacteroidota bacterium]
MDNKIPEIKRANAGFFIAAALLIVLDQATKLAVKGFDLFGIEYSGIGYGTHIPVIGDFLQITFIENEGMAFGISFGAWKILLSLFSIFAGGFLGVILARLNRYSFWVQTGVMLIFAGAVGNLIDRVFYGLFYGYAPLFYGRVVDFVLVDIPDVSVFGLSYNYFPVFNVADSCVTVGVAILLIAHRHLPKWEQVLRPKSVPDDPAGNEIEQKNPGMEK